MALTISSISLSGILAGGRRLATSADNIARRPVTNSEKNRVITEEVAGGGVTTSVRKIPLEESQKVASDEENQFYSASNIDYAEEFIEQSLAALATRTSIKVFENAKEMDEAILNIKV